MIRPYRATDFDAMYEVCVLTGDSGSDATGQYGQPRLLGDVFVGPYVKFEPGLAFVIDDGNGVEGYILGALDSTEFARRCEQEWWPDRRAHYRDYRPPAGLRDQWLLSWIDQPPPVPEFAAQFPSHLHVDLLPKWQGGGWGRRLMETLFAALTARGSTGVHLGVNRINERAVGFYRHLGFAELAGDDDMLWMGKPLG